MNLLITSIHGFVGTNLVQVLKAKQTIYGLDIINPVKEGILKTYGWDELDSLPPIYALAQLFIALGLVVFINYSYLYLSVIIVVLSLIYSVIKKKYFYLHTIKS